MEGGGTGLCHISEIAEGYVKDVKRVFWLKDKKLL